MVKRLGRLPTIAPGVGIEPTSYLINSQAHSPRLLPRNEFRPTTQITVGINQPNELPIGEDPLPYGKTVKVTAFGKDHSLVCTDYDEVCLRYATHGQLGLPMFISIYNDRSLREKLQVANRQKPYLN